MIDKIVKLSLARKIQAIWLAKRISIYPIFQILHETAL